MKARILTPLLLTGAFLTCAQSVFADQTTHDQDVLNLIDEIRADLAKLEKAHLGAADTQRSDILSGNKVDDAIADIEVKRPIEVNIGRDSLPPIEVPGAVEPLNEEVLPAESKKVELSKVHGLIKNYMDAQGSTARMIAEKVIRDEYKIDHKNACFETVKYIQDGGKGQEAKFGTLFSLMDMDPRYATKGNKDILKGIKEGVQMREKDAHGVYFKQKVKFTPEMLCKK